MGTSCCAKSDLLSIPKGERNTGQGQIMGTKSYIGIGTALSVMLHEACVCKRDAPMCVRIRLGPLRREDSSRVLIGAGRTWSSDWRSWDVGVVIGQSGFSARSCR